MRRCFLAEAIFILLSMGLNTSVSAQTGVGAQTTQLPLETYIWNSPTANLPLSSTAMIPIIPNGNAGSTMKLPATLLGNGFVFKVEAKTANYQITTDDNLVNFDNTGAVAEVDFTLPVEAPALKYCFTVVAAQTLKIFSQSGTTIAIGSTNSASGGALISSTPYSSLCVYSPTNATTQWVTKDFVGYWTVSP